jgi:phosphate butyryltransferase
MKNFEEIRRRAQAVSAKPRIAVVVPDRHSLEAVTEAVDLGLASAAFFMTTTTEQYVLDQVRNSEFSYYVLETAEEAAEYAVAACAASECQMLMKGNLDSSVLLHAVLKKDSGLTTGKLLTHLAWLEMPSYHKLFIVTDGGMIPYPSLEEKEGILQHAVSYSQRLGLSRPKVAVLAATEKVNPKLRETREAAYLKEQAVQGKYGNCMVEGPISFDLAYMAAAAAAKGYNSPVAGDADVLLVPDLVSGNLLAKGLVYSGGGKMAGLIVGARIPILLISRSASAAEKMNTIALAVVLAQTPAEKEAR